KYNKDVQNAANAAFRDSVYTRGGDWSNMQAQGYKQPNFWGDMTSGLSSAMETEQNAQIQPLQNKLLKAITKIYENNGNQLYFGIASSKYFTMASTRNRYSLGVL